VTSRNRKIGDIVWDEVTPSCGPLRDKTIGLKRGRVSNIFTDRRGRESVQVEWFGDMEPQTGTIRAAAEIPDHSARSTKFDWGVVNAKELGIIIKGGLLDGEDGCFTEPQCDGLIALHPLYQLALDNPGAAVVINPEYSAILPAAVTG
jgi:hypothetical protein